MTVLPFTADRGIQQLLAAMAGIATKIVVVLAFLLPCLASPEESDSVIRVYGNSATCGSPLCGDLDGVFARAQKNSTVKTIQLSSGCFNLNSAEVAVFQKKDDFAIVSNDSAMICCFNSSGLTFIGSNSIHLENITLHGCGAPQNSTSKNFSDTDFSYIKFRVGLYFSFCNDVTLLFVTVENSNGTGLVLYNTGGENTFQHCFFEENQVQDGDWDSAGPGGGGVIVEFSYCIPGDTSCAEATSDVTNTNAIYDFYECRFESNVASDTGASFIPIYPHGRDHNAFGHGGGLSVHFKGNSFNNTVLIDKCRVIGNWARIGGGVYVKFEDKSQSNAVHIVDSTIDWNSCSCEDLKYATATVPKLSAAGGGVRIELVAYPPDQDLWPGYVANVTGNELTFSNSYVLYNLACWGGGVSFSSTRAEPGKPVTNSLQFLNSHFRFNRARIAAAVDLSLWYPDTGNGSVLEPLFENCTFYKNSVRYPNISGYEFGMGALYINEVPTVFVGNTSFQGNDGTGLVIANTGVRVMQSATMMFSSNTGRSGSALAFIGDAWLVAYNKTRFEFVDNQAEVNGGAIYAVHFGGHDLVYQQSCFIRYYKQTLHPNNWTATFSFRNNSVLCGVGSSIYATSILPCAWPSSDPAHKDESIPAFCWDTWSFENSKCTNEVATAPARYNNSYPYPFNTTAYPGQRFQMPIQAFNDYDELLKQSDTVFRVWSENRNVAIVDPNSRFVANGSMVVFGAPNQNATIMLQTLDPRVISTELKVGIKPCPPGYISEPYTEPNGTNGAEIVRKCKCSSFSVFKCDDDDDDLGASILSRNCITPLYKRNRTGAISNKTTDLTGSELLVIGKCPYSDHHLTETLLPLSALDLETSMCGSYKREGTLCGRCLPHHGVTVNTYKIDCTKCTNYAFNWLIYIFSEFLPITIFFIIVAIFKISATSAQLNGFVFFCQIIALPHFRNRYPWVFGLNLQHDFLRDVFLTPYGIWNLDFFRSLEPGFCLSPHITTLQFLALGYLTALYPLILVATCFICIELHARNFRPLVWLWRPCQRCLSRFHRSWEPKTSIVDAFATFLLLAYTKLSIVSFSILSSTQLHDTEGNQVGGSVLYFDAEVKFLHGEHIGFALLAITVLVVFVALPPFFLIVYPLKIFHRLLNACSLRCHALHIFADSFQGCFKDGTNGARDCRYFAALYFVFRIAVYTIYITEQNAMVQYLLQQILTTLAIILFASLRPYKQDFYNNLDTALFSLLAILNALSFYNLAHTLEHSGISPPVFVINYILIFVPFLYISGYIIYQFLMWQNCFTRCLKAMKSQWLSERDPNSETASLTAENSERFYSSTEDDEVPDRLLNPQNYTPNIPSARSTQRNNWNSEQSYFAAPARRVRQYGSMQTQKERSSSSDSAEKAKQREFHTLA